jgi:hypothetical protein
VTKDFDTLKPGPVRKAAMEAGHQFVVRLADGLRLKRLITSVRKLNLPAPIPAFQQVHLATAQRTAAVIEDFESKAVWIWLVLQFRHQPPFIVGPIRVWGDTACGLKSNPIRPSAEI